MSPFLNITIDGVDYIAIPKASFGSQPLDEEAFDVARYDRIKEQLASSEEELMPAAFADRIFDGESPLRVWREFRGLTLQSLAEKTDTSRAYLSEIENGHKDGSIRIMKRVADALNVGLDDIV
ncbi:MAG: helix-turn-helix transcriptional regulator [Magnetococcales bacterium]|nr:helix-turn-helix transcriptional regulator [Magnetococcales bacterium]